MTEGVRLEHGKNSEGTMERRGEQTKTNERSIKQVIDEEQDYLFRLLKKDNLMPGDILGSFQRLREAAEAIKPRWNLVPLFKPGEKFIVDDD